MEKAEIELSSLRLSIEKTSIEASHLIYRVPKQLREVNPKAYNPRMVSIGPYHHGGEGLEKMEDMKLRCMKSLLERKPEVKLEDYFSEIAVLEKQARDCYAEAINLSELQFIEMLVLDGSFIIELLGGRISHECIPNRFLECLQRDLILLENQIPFLVLRKLFYLIEFKGQDHLMESILQTVPIIFRKPFLPDLTMRKRSQEVEHILDLVHCIWDPPSVDTKLESGQLNIPSASMPEDVDTKLESGQLNISSASQLEDVDTNLESDRLNIPSASLLKDANVKFKKKCDADPKKLHESKGTTVFDVEFKDGGVMLMPPVLIDDNTESFLRNMIAYEQYLPSAKLTPFSDYANLLDCLINSPKDVQILTHHEIIENFLGSDEAVVNFVNQLTDNVTFCPDNFVYGDTFVRINKHHKKWWNRAVAVFHRDYFNSPWAYVSFVGALVLLLLTATQAVFAALDHFN